MTPLPHGLTDPLHILEPTPWKGLLVTASGIAVFLAFNAALAFLLWRRIRRSRGAAPPPPAPPPPRATGIAAAIEDLRRRFLASESYRAGCHELSERLRQHFGGRLSRRLATLTALEVGRLLGEGPGARLLRLVSELQFGRQRPTRNDFEGACDLALDLVQEEAYAGQRRP